jgi:DNA helicase-2/ATP-dependent DNA helicase PcrA
MIQPAIYWQIFDMFTWPKSDLSLEQEAAILIPGSVFLVACPGSGKTRTLAYKIALELSKLESKKKRIIAITYTNRAADEIKDRVELLGVDTDQLWIGTIHAFCLDWIIKPYGIYHSELKYGYRIINSYDTEEIITGLCKAYTTPKLTFYDVGYYYTSQGLRLTCKPQHKSRARSVIDRYYETLRLNRQIDFELILWYSFELISNNSFIAKLLGQIFDFILVDEFQDTREIQYEILSHIFRAGNGRVHGFVVGDPNQAIFESLGGYSIEAADLSKLSCLNFQPTTLSENYRSSDAIVQYFSQFKVFQSPIVSKSSHKDYSSVIVVEQDIKKDELIDYIANLINSSVTVNGTSQNEICVIAPWWMHLATLTRGLVSALPDYNFNGPGLTPIARDIENFWYKLARIGLTVPSPGMYSRRIRWSREVISQMDDVGIDISKLTPKKLLKIINSINLTENDGLSYLQALFEKTFMRLGIDYTTNSSLSEHHTAFFDSSNARIQRISKEVEYASSIENFRKAFSSKSGVTISSIHGVKGAEFDVVIAFGLLEGIVPHFSDSNPRSSAKKLLYVIGSRARKNLYMISEAERKKGWNGYYEPTVELIK